MQLEDLQKIVHLAQTQNLQLSANSFNLTAGALSKTLKKVESTLKTELFARTGKYLQLNNNGRRFVTYATQILHEYEQMHSEFTSHYAQHKVKLCGPGILLNHCMPLLLNKLSPQAEVEFDIQFEGNALRQVVTGQAHIAIVTAEVLGEASKQQLRHVPLGQTVFQLAVAKQHTLATQEPVQLSQVLKYTFACPSSSPFCGVQRGRGSDGWPDGQHQRKIGYRSDDFSTLISIVKSGNCLAYMPNIAIDSNNLHPLAVQDFDYQYEEKYYLLYKPSLAQGWLNQFITKLAPAP